jgi:hypothetical protein
MRKWLLLSLVFPLVAWLLAKLADEIQARRGESGVTHALRLPHRLRHRSAG